MLRSILLTLSWGERHNDPSGPQRAGPDKGRSVNDSSLSGLSSSSGVHERAVILQLHRFNHAQSGQRIDKEDAPWRGEVPSGSGRQLCADAQRYWAYMAPPKRATVLPSSAWAASDVPASTTTPAPSLPTGKGLSTRAVTLACSSVGMGAESTGIPFMSAVCAALISAGPNSNPRSDGLIGAASIRTRTSSALGVGTSTFATDTSSTPLARTVDCHCNVVVMWFSFKQQHKSQSLVSYDSHRFVDRSG